MNHDRQQSSIIYPNSCSGSLFYKKLTRRLDYPGLVHLSGWVRTEIGSGHILQYPYYLWLLMTGKSPRQGAQTTLHCCLTDEKVTYLITKKRCGKQLIGILSPFQVNGKFYSNCSVESNRLTTPYVNDEYLVEVAHAKTKKLLGI